MRVGRNTIDILDLSAHLRGFERHLRAANRSPATIWPRVGRAATAATRFQALRVFFGCLVEEGELDRSPMVRMKAPIVPETPVPVVDEEFLRTLLRGCAGRDFGERFRSKPV